MSIVKEYATAELTIIWKPELCIHSANCWKGLPAVFKPKEKPWIAAENASAQQIVSQIAKCASGALSTILKSKKSNDND